MTLSIIIVNYNVKYFLEQCLCALQQATVGMAAQVIVVDNGSTDDSLCYLQPRFPQVQFIQNQNNAGFGNACNSGLEKATGETILFLNPDTIIAEDTLHTCLNFLKTHAGAGALGVRMIDGSGRFLKESKRAFPSPLTSLFKLFGLARLFPRSPLFSRYHLGHLDAHQNHEVDVLAGAFMMIRKSVLEKVGAFDEAFFMYGEDVDLSYRIQKAGYKNYYVAETEIIHFKGESTKRGSLNYVRMFYSAMSTFVKKHYGGSRATIFNGSIHIAIWVRAAMAALAKVIGWIGLPVLDALLFLGSFWAIKELWERTVKPENTYPGPLLLILFPCFTVFYLIIAFYAGLYEKQYKPANLLRAGLVATVALLAAYSLLPEEYRFSRGIILFGALLAFAGMSALRWLLTQAGIVKPAIYRTAKPDVLVAGSVAEYAELKMLLNGRSAAKLIGRLAVTEEPGEKIAMLDQVDKVAAALNARELVLCSGTVSNKTWIRFIQTVQPPLRLRFHAAGSSSVVGSDSSTASGEAVSATVLFNLSMPTYRRLKRLIDVTIAFLFLLFFPVHFLLLQHPVRLLAHAGSVLLGNKTWIGYAAQTAALPPLRPAVLTSDGDVVHGGLKKLQADHAQIDFWYAQNWEPLQDVKLILKNYRQLGS